MNARTTYEIPDSLRQILSNAVMILLAIAPYALAAVIAVAFYQQILPNFRQYGWTDDWIYIKPLAFTTFGEWWQWLWQQHVDHRIPIQKLTNFYILTLSGFDYRPIVGINFVMALATSVFLVEAAKEYRGRRSIGDLGIPLILLNFSMGYTQWAFHFQFMSSVLCMSGFLLSLLKWMRLQTRTPAVFMFVTLSLATMTGMNGVLPAMGAGVAFTVWALWRRKPASVVLLLVVPTTICFIILFFWKPYAGGDNTLSVQEFALYAFGLTTSSFTMFLQNYETVARIIIATMLVAAAVAALIRLRDRKTTDTDLAVYAMLGIYLCLIASISYGRVKIQGGWDFGSSIHYGVLTVFVPVTCWFIISRAMPRLGAEIVGLVFLVIAAWVFQANYYWRTWMVDYNRPLQEKVMQDLVSDKPIEQTARENVMQFHFHETGVPQIVDGITALREAGMPIYGGKSN